MDDYSNRELDRMFTEIKGLLHEIRDQTTKTNGRVTTLEMWKEGLAGKLIGATAVLGVSFELLFRVLPWFK